MTPRRLLAVLALAGLLLGARPPAAPAFSAGDPFREEQWALPTIGAPDAWTRGRGAGATVAVVDTGIDLDHEDLVGKIAGHVSCIGADGDPARCSGPGDDDHGHGTHVAGIAAAVTGNGVGVAGVAPDAALLGVRALQKDHSDPTGGASGYVTDIRAGIAWAVDHGAHVINLSLSENVLVRGLFGSGLERAVRDAWERGVIVVIAAGNTNSLFGSGYGSLPAMVVTATDVDDEQAAYATDVGSAKWGMAAPGGDGSAEEGQILSTWCGHCTTDGYRYAYAKGTSMSAPQVAGAAAVLRGLGLTPLQTVNRILETAVDLGVPGRDHRYGYGRLDLGEATAIFPQVAAAPAPAPAPPPPAPPQPPPPPPPPPEPETHAAAAPDRGERADRAAPPTTATTEPTPEPAPERTEVPPEPVVDEPPADDEAALAGGGDAPPGGSDAGWAVAAGTLVAAMVLGARRAWLRRLSLPR